MIPYMVGKLAPNSTHFTRDWSNKSPGGDFRAVPSQNGDKNVTSPPPSIVERTPQSRAPSGTGSILL